MKKNDVLRDILQTRISNQVYYNENVITVRNPEVRQIFTQLRDDEMRSIVRLQKKVQRLESPPGIITKILPSKPKY